MKTAGGDMDELLSRAADLRAGGASWELVARELGRKPETCRRWPSRHPKRWAALLREAEDRTAAEARAEAVLTLRQLMRSDDEKVRRDAAGKLAAHRPDRGRRPAKATSESSNDDAARLARFVEALDDAQIDALVAELLGQRAAGVGGRGAGPNGPPGAGRPE